MRHWPFGLFANLSCGTCPKKNMPGVLKMPNVCLSMPQVKTVTLWLLNMYVLCSFGIYKGFIFFININNTVSLDTALFLLKLNYLYFYICIIEHYVAFMCIVFIVQSSSHAYIVIGSSLLQTHSLHKKNYFLILFVMQQAEIKKTFCQNQQFISLECFSKFCPKLMC